MTEIIFRRARERKRERSKCGGGKMARRGEERGGSGEERKEGEEEEKRKRSSVMRTHVGAREREGREDRHGGREEWGEARKKEREAIA